MGVSINYFFIPIRCIFSVPKSEYSQFYYLCFCLPFIYYVTIGTGECEKKVTMDKRGKNVTFVTFF